MIALWSVSLTGSGRGVAVIESAYDNGRLKPLVWKQHLRKARLSRIIENRRSRLPRNGYEGAQIDTLLARRELGAEVVLERNFAGSHDYPTTDMDGFEPSITARNMSV